MSDRYTLIDWDEFTSGAKTTDEIIEDTRKIGEGMRVENLKPMTFQDFKKGAGNMFGVESIDKLRDRITREISDHIMGKRKGKS